MSDMTVEQDIAAGRQFRLLSALLDHDAAPWQPGAMPPLGHWLLFPPSARQSLMGVDGHPLRDPNENPSPAEFPRRMWAGGRVTFLAPIAIGATIEKQTDTARLQEKSGRSGRMVFKTLRHRLFCDGQLAIEEEQDLVYREAAPVTPASAKPAPAADAAEPATPPAYSSTARALSIDTVELMRFSALTFNAHRIHYDRDYATQEEGYPDLVVHGPFIATMLMDHFLRLNPQASVRSFSFRAQSPLFTGVRFTLDHAPDGEKRFELRAHQPDGTLAMQAFVEVE